jgi:homoserine kinase
MARVRVRVPATTANLGPGFDCLGLALDLWNETLFSLEGEGLQIQLSGEGKGRLPLDRSNVMAYAFRHFCRTHAVPEPVGLRIHSCSAIPTSSGLGSSASAALLGLLAASALLQIPAGPEELLALAAGMEGHADNAAAALYGGLVVILAQGDGWLVRRFDVPPIQVVFVLPEVNLPTRVSREALPKQVSLADAVFNLGRTPLVVEALRTGDLDLLSRVMDDRLHQPHRLRLIPGGPQAMQASRQAGAAAVALSGAGPSLVAFCDETGAGNVGQAMQDAFASAGVQSRLWQLKTTCEGAKVEMEDW